MSIFSLGSYFIYICSLESYKQDFRKFVAQDKLASAITTIQINPSNLYINSSSLSWEDDYKEVVYNGNLYDVISIKSVGINVLITLISDTQEMDLKKQFLTSNK